MSKSSRGQMHIVSGQLAVAFHAQAIATCSTWVRDALGARRLSSNVDVDVDLDPPVPFIVIWTLTRRHDTARALANDAEWSTLWRQWQLGCELGEKGTPVKRGRRAWGSGDGLSGDSWRASEARSEISTFRARLYAHTSLDDDLRALSRTTRSPLKLLRGCKEHDSLQKVRQVCGGQEITGTAWYAHSAQGRSGTQCWASAVLLSSSRKQRNGNELKTYPPFQPRPVEPESLKIRSMLQRGPNDAQWIRARAPHVDGFRSNGGNSLAIAFFANVPLTVHRPRLGWKGERAQRSATARAVGRRWSMEDRKARPLPEFEGLKSDVKGAPVTHGPLGALALVGLYNHLTVGPPPCPSRYDVQHVWGRSQCGVRARRETWLPLSFSNSKHLSIATRRRVGRVVPGTLYDVHIWDASVRTEKLHEVYARTYILARCVVEVRRTQRERAADPGADNGCWTAGRSATASATARGRDEGSTTN
ncbi:hypothetical protein LXA43DRAFT_1082557 [Ganoderma leucocontextum]|nr:hypothetical protein LXA43DRAFT_1082557 [Ganoderma leucocontextum]